MGQVNYDGPCKVPQWWSLSGPKWCTLSVPTMMVLVRSTMMVPVRSTMMVPYMSTMMVPVRSTIMVLAGCTKMKDPWGVFNVGLFMNRPPPRQLQLRVIWRAPTLDNPSGPAGSARLNVKGGSDDGFYLNISDWILL